MDLEELEEALQATSPKTTPKTRMQAAKAAVSGTGVVTDDEVNAFAVNVENFLGSIDQDLTVAEVRDLLHTRKMML